VRVRIGTSGYSYKEWKGPFYPADLPAGRMLSYYAARFDSVEINATFYRMPTEKVLLDWATQVPEQFTFVLKAPRRITHEGRLAGVEQAADYLFRTATVLGRRLGPTLFQLPPNFRKDLARLRAFLPLVPRGWRAAFEFRHDSWFDDDVFAALREHDAALCINDMGEGEVNAPFVSTATWGQLESWAAQVGQQAWSDAFVFFKHEEEGTGPRLAAEFRTLLPPG
jgi:uncharacterized protein YecE (DUF72 family)